MCRSVLFAMIIDNKSMFYHKIMEIYIDLCHYLKVYHNTLLTIYC